MKPTAYLRGQEPRGYGTATLLLDGHGLFFNQ